MAVWQVTIDFIPLQWAEENGFKTEKLYDEDGFDPTCTWIDQQPRDDFEKVFDAILPRSESWSKDLTLWGDTKTNDISVWRDDANVSSIDFRLDLSKNYVSLMNSLVDSAISLNCVLFIPGQHVVIKPNIFELKKHILKSSAAKYVKDPEAFFNDVGSEK
ncbi:hypothetical protein [Colwellia sp. Arc7-D]|uniref:hypothetical protein n=1 Tax=Colwellia sp. Arc7-D TaxID=2161872 RepID=UPI000D33C255|nr:hypothetical protein [Colwellia sp. Arc7-D]AWB57592.1 hypothetical protein DBO93_08475 [Colwellia sp. Arc7-D]